MSSPVTLERAGQSTEHSVCATTSVSVLVRDSIDPVAIARRVGHGSASFTLRQYAHLFNPDDRRSANALGAALRGRAPEAPAAADSVERQQADGS
jgi:hypothetical protein